MKEQELNSRVQQTLDMFESLEYIQPSAGWDQSLSEKLASSASNHPSSFQTARSVIVMLVVILLNVGIILTFITNDNRRSFNRSHDLQAISKEFLINPNSITE